ncbi:MAG: hypothetical protein WC119_00900 [Synergistaceae bacterium]
METYAVIEMNSDDSKVFLSARSFPYTREGKRDAEQLFLNCMKENGAKKDEFPQAIEDGTWEIGTYHIVLVTTE